MPSEDRDIVADVGKRGSRGLSLILHVLNLNLSNNFTAGPVGTSTTRGHFSFFRIRAATNISYRVMHNVVFFVFWRTLLRPTAGAVVSIRLPTTLQNVPWLCIQEKFWAISSWSSTATSAENIA